MLRLKLLSLCSAVVLFHLTGVVRAQIVPVSGNACDGTFAGSFNGNVTVAAGQTCHFIGGGIVGNVKVNGGILNLDGTTVSGNVQLQGSGNVVLTRATVVGNVQIDGGGTFSINFASINGDLHIQNIPAGPTQNQICGTIVTGNLQFKNNGTAVQIGAPSLCSGNTIGTSFQVQNNSASTTLFNNTSSGDTQDQNNAAPTLVIGNAVGGNLQVQNNTASATVSFNNVSQNLQCENDSSISGGSNIAGLNQGCPTVPQAAAFATFDGSRIVFKSPAGNAVLTLPLLNQEVVTPTPAGNVIRTTNQTANISDDGSHAGIYTSALGLSPTDIDTEPVVTASFAYYDATGQLWQVPAPLGKSFYSPIDTSQRSVTPDGSRVLLISADDGNTNPAFSVYDQGGNLLYQSAGSFLELYQAQISPNGKYLLVLGIVKASNVYQDLITVTDLTTGISSRLSVNLATNFPVISIAPDGRFLISYQGTQTALPPE